MPYAAWRATRLAAAETRDPLGVGAVSLSLLSRRHHRSRVQSSRVPHPDRAALYGGGTAFSRE
jgi:hypothetical protein